MGKLYWTVIWNGIFYYFTNIAQKNTMLISNLARFSYEKYSHLVVKGSATKSWPFQYLLVQSQQWKYDGDMLNLLRVNIKAPKRCLVSLLLT